MDGSLQDIHNKQKWKKKNHRRKLILSSLCIAFYSYVFYYQSTCRIYHTLRPYRGITRQANTYTIMYPILLIGALALLPLVVLASRNAGGAPQAAKRYARLQGLSVAILGDSLSVGAGSPGGVVARRLREQGATVQIDAKSGRSAISYMGEERTPLRANLVIVFLGTNDVLWPTEKAISAMKQLLDTLPKNAKIVAIGPPTFDNKAVGSGGGHMQERSYLWMPKASRLFASRGIPFLNSNAITNDLTSRDHRKEDLIHFNGKGAELFGNRIFEVLFRRV